MTKTTRRLLAVVCIAVLVVTATLPAGFDLSAVLVYLGTTVFGFGLPGFARVNLVLVILWIAVAVLLIREYRALSARTAAEG